jgi:hypothetical protein
MLRVFHILKIEEPMIFAGLSRDCLTAENVVPTPGTDENQRKRFAFLLIDGEAAFELQKFSHHFVTETYQKRPIISSLVLFGGVRYG